MITWTAWRMGRWAMAAVALVLARIFWCELHGFATGADLVGLDVSMPWALKASAGWILVGALLGLHGGRLMDSPAAARHPFAIRAALTAGILAITLGSETWLLMGDTALSLWLYERAPAHATFTVLLVAGYLFIRRRPTTNPASIEASMLDVMTGTGRTRVRIEDIECLEADRNYVSVHTPQRSYLVRQTLGSLEASLRSETFLRIHRSTIVNRNRIRERRPGGVLVLQSGRTVRVSRAFSDRVKCH
jgi:DNA-binding LytR/AlgR family response regulator